MQKKYRVSLWVGVSVLLLTMSAAAQSEKRALATIPFDFVAAKHQFSAGTYEVVTRGSQLSLRDADGRLLAILGTHPAVMLDAAENSKLVFYDIDGRHFLARVWFAGNSEGSEMIRAGSELEVARKFSGDSTMRASARETTVAGK